MTTAAPPASPPKGNADLKAPIRTIPDYPTPDIPFATSPCCCATGPPSPMQRSPNPSDIATHRHCQRRPLPATTPIMPARGSPCRSAGGLAAYGGTMAALIAHSDDLFPLTICFMA